MRTVWCFRDQELRLDQAVAQAIGVSRSKAQTWIREGYVRVAGRPVTKPAYWLRGEEVWVDPPPDLPQAVIPEAIDLEVLYEDDDLLVINKPAGMITHPAPGIRQGTLVNAILGRWVDAAWEEPWRAGIVHRLDKETSGVLLVARHEAAHRALAEAFRDRRVAKRYLALTVGRPREGRLVAPIGRHPLERTRMHVGGLAPRYAETRFLLRASAGEISLVEAHPLTGRTHQIRVHLKYLGTPILGDLTYGHPSPWIGRHALHAYALRFPHPRREEWIECIAPVPQDFIHAWEIAGGTWPEDLLR